MKRKFAALVMTGALCVSAMSLSVYAEATENAEVTETAEEQKEELKTIGTEAENSYKATVKNLTGKGIKGIAFKELSDDEDDTEEEEFGKNLLEEEDIFASEESRILYYSDDVEDVEESQDDAEESAETEDAEEEFFDVQITLEDDVVYVLHEFSFADLEAFEIIVEEDVAYIKYMSVKDEKEVDTKAAELEIKNAEAAEVPAETYTETYTETYDDTDYDYDYDYDYSYDSGYDSGYSSDSYYEAPAGDACLDGGLLN